MFGGIMTTFLITGGGRAAAGIRQQRSVIGSRSVSGLWTQEEKGDAFMFLQLSVNKSGVISGAYANVLSGEKEPVAGRIGRLLLANNFRHQYVIYIINNYEKDVCNTSRRAAVPVCDA